MIWTWNFGGGPWESALVYFKIVSAKGDFIYGNLFDAVLAIIDLNRQRWNNEYQRFWGSWDGLSDEKDYQTLLLW